MTQESMFRAHMDVALRTISIFLMATLWPTAFALWTVGELSAGPSLERWLPPALCLGGVLQTLAVLSLLSGRRRLGQVLAVGGWFVVGALVSVVSSPTLALPVAAAAAVFGVLLSAVFEEPKAILCVTALALAHWLATLGLWVALRNFAPSVVEWVVWITVPSAMIVTTGMLVSWFMAQMGDLFALLELEQHQAAGDKARLVRNLIRCIHPRVQRVSTVLEAEGAPPRTVAEHRELVALTTALLQWSNTLGHGRPSESDRRPDQDIVLDTATRA